MKALGVHVFAGSFSIGVQEHADVLGHLEFDGYAVDTARANYDFPIYESRSEWPEDPEAEFGGVDLVFGNPPCAPFSRQRNSEGAAEDDERVGRIEEVVETADALRPRVWAFESVTQAYTGNSGVIDAVEGRARGMGYNVTHYLHDVNFHGLPQKRRRYLFIAHDMPVDWDLPEPERVSVKESGLLGDCGGSVEIAPNDGLTEERWRDLIPRMDRGDLVRDHWKSAYEGSDEDGGWTPFSSSRRMRWEEPCNAVLGGCRFVHPLEDRFLTMRELARLMGYPDDFEFRGSGVPSNRAYQVARGVAAPVGEWLARNVREHLDRSPEQTGMSVVIDTRDEQFGYRFFEA